MKQNEVDNYFKTSIQPIWKGLDENTKSIIKTLIEAIKNNNDKIQTQVEFTRKLNNEKEILEKQVNNSANLDKDYFLDGDKKQWDIAIKTLYSYEIYTPEQYRDINKKTYNYLKKLPLVYSCINDEKLGLYLSSKKKYLVIKAREKALIDENISTQSLDKFYSDLYNNEAKEK